MSQSSLVHLSMTLKTSPVNCCGTRSRVRLSVSTFPLLTCIIYNIINNRNTCPLGCNINRKTIVIPVTFAKKETIHKATMFVNLQNQKITNF